MAPDRIIILKRNYQPISDDAERASPALASWPSTNFAHHVKRRKSMLIIAIVLLFSLFLVLLTKFYSNRGVNQPLLSSSESTDNVVRFNTSTGIYSLYETKSSLKPLATGKYIKNVNSNGWNYMEVIASELPSKHLMPTTGLLSNELTDLSDSLVEDYLKSLRAVGHLEGFMTCNDITSWYLNFYSGLFDGSDPTEDALDFLQSNYDWMVSMAGKHWKYSEHWLAVRGLLAQLDGLVSGQQHGCPGTDSSQSSTSRIETQAFLPTLKKRPALIHFLLMNANGDLFQIAEKFDQKDAPPSDIIPDDLLNTVYNGPGDTGGADKLKPSKINLQSSSRVRLRKRGSVMTESHVSNDNTTWRAPGKWAHQHCSALVKLLPDRSDVVFGHNTWDDYQLMAPRIFKHISHHILIPTQRQGGSNAIIYRIQTSSDLKSQNSKQNPKLNVDDDNVNKDDTDTIPTAKPLRHEVYFSSCPGLLTSVDDFYTLSGRANLAVTETSLDIYNTGLFALIHSESLLSWVRARVSNLLAIDGSSWARLFSAYHSGTYANQWMVINLDLFTPGSDPKPEFLTVLEEVPGYIHFEDVTSHITLADYWASYNNPFFDDIFILSGYLDLCMSDPTSCHYTDPRALLFHQLQGSVVDVESLGRVLAHNQFQTDAVANNDSCNAISCRQDLEPNPQYRYPFGAVDAKVSSVLMARGEEGSRIPKVYARLGPTTDNQPPFCWSQFDSLRNARGKRFSHVGHPQCFNYQWQLMPPQHSDFHSFN